MIAKLTGLVAATSAPALAKGLLVALGASLVLAAGVAAWITLLYHRVDTMQVALDDLHRKAGQMEIVLRDVNLDRDLLRLQVQRQSEAIETLRSDADRLRADADRRASLILELPTPPAGTGVTAMNDWWQQNVVR